MAARGGADDPPVDPIARVAGGLGGWALGGRALELPDGLAFPVPKGSDLILSTHFHPSGKAQMEKSTVGLYFASGPPTQAFTTIQLPPLFGVFEGIDIPAGQERYTLQDSFVIPIDVKAFSVGAHAHYLGKEMKLTATLPDGAVKTLLWIKDWDFSWQERYRFKDFVTLPAGTRLDASCQLRQLGGEQAQSEPSAGARHVGRGIERRDGQHRIAGGRRDSRRAAATAARVQRASAHRCDDAARVAAIAATATRVMSRSRTLTYAHGAAEQWHGVSASRDPVRDLIQARSPWRWRRSVSPRRSSSGCAHDACTPRVRRRSIRRLHDRRR